MWQWFFWCTSTLITISTLISIGSASAADCHLYNHVLYDVFALNKGIICTSKAAHSQHNAVYVLYDVNPSEGFNLRRDVYIRLAVFVRKMQQQQNERFKNLKLVLPPWRRLYHWKSNGLQQDYVNWSSFFNIESMRRYVKVLDFPEFVEEIHQLELQEKPLISVHHTLQLLHFQEMFENGVFRDRYEFLPACPHDYKPYEHLFKQQSILLEDARICVRFQGSANLLEKVLWHALRKLQPPLGTGEPAIIALLNSEIVLHNSWGDKEFWLARRSMRFAQHLMNIANDFRRTYLNSTSVSDFVQRPPMWELEEPKRNARGGSYLCAHLRRGDFVYGREHTTPSLKSAAQQIKHHLRELNLTTVFLATDANIHELKNLKSYMQRVRVVNFSSESLEQKKQIKDGGIAIIDQLICAHARYFIGTYESTFTYRIYEEREILGFPKNSTFNTFCKSETFDNCLQNTIWPIVY